MVDFLIIGTRRAGSSSFYRDMLQHPQIVSAYKDDTNFFDLHYSKGLEWYVRQFPLLSEYSEQTRPSGNITGEASPHYMFHPLVAERVKRHYPQMKLIVILRNPTDRAYSHFRHAVENGHEHLSFNDALRVEAKRLERGRFNLEDNPFHEAAAARHNTYISHGYYAQQLRTWFRHFDKSHFLVIRTEDYFTNPQPEIAKAFAFLGLSPLPAIRAEARTVDPYERLRSETRSIVDNLYRRPNEELCHLLGWQRAW